MAALTGKTHSRHFRLFLDGVNVSGDARTVGSFGQTYNEDDVTGWTDGVVNFLLGHVSTFLNGFQAVFSTTAVTAAFTELKAREDYIVTLQMGIKAAPLLSDPCFCAVLEQKNIDVAGEGPMLLTVDLFSPGQLPAAGVTATHEAQPTKVWGVVLEPGSTSRTATLTGSSVDNGASSASGALGYLHVTVSSGGTWALKIQDSPDDNAWSDLITFDAIGDIVEAEQEYATGTVDQYTRVLFTRTSGSLTAACAIVRL